MDEHKTQTIKTSVAYNNYPIGLIVGLMLMTIVIGFLSGFVGYKVADYSTNGYTSRKQSDSAISQVKQSVSIDETSATTTVAKNSTPSVVSIVAYEKISTSNNTRSNLFNQLFGNNLFDNNQGSSSSTRQEVSAGSGFIVTDNGYILTNRHVVESTTAEYEVVLNDGSKLTAKVIDRDTYLDIAVLKIVSDKTFTPLKLGDSDSILVGQVAIAIGNSLGEFSNTVSKGILSGLDRSIQASDSSGTGTETLDHIIQTDASINSGNSGGPLLDSQGNVIGVNVAKASGGENIGFAIAINDVKGILESAIKTGRIVRPYIGVRFTELTPEINKLRGLGYDYGAWLFSTNIKTPSIIADSPADKAGLKDGDIILEIGGQKLDATHTLRRTVQKFNVGDKIKIKYARDKKESEVELTLVELPKN